MAAPLLSLVAAAALASPGSPPAGYTLTRVSDGVSGASLSGISQLAFGPGEPTLLYAARPSGVITRYDLDPPTGALSNPVNVATGLTAVYGLAFRGGDLYVSLNPSNDSRIARLRDLDHDGLFEERVDFVWGVPNKDHGIDQLQIVGATLFAGIGTRSNSGNPTCEFAYTGTIARIADLDQVDYSGVVNALPSATEYVNPAPADGKLRRFAFGLRNPFGVRVDALGHVWVSDNGASFCNTCSSCNNFGTDTHDFLYRDVPVGAKGQFPPAGYPGGGGATITPLATLGFHAAVTGFAFMTAGPDAGQVVLAEYGPSDTSIPVGRDVIAVDPVTGSVTWSIPGFNRPTDVLSDAGGRLWIADYAEPAIYLLTPPGIVAVEPPPRGEPAPAARLVAVRPDPELGHVTIEFEMGGEPAASLRILDVTGRLAAQLPVPAAATGRQVARWDGARVQGGPAAPGVYFVILETRLGISARRFAKLR